MKKLVLALVMCLAVFGPAPWISQHAVLQPLAVVPAGGAALLSPPALRANDSAPAAAVSIKLLAIGSTSERNQPSDKNLRSGGANKLANGHRSVIGAPLLC